MGSSSTRVECRLCLEWCTIDAYRKHHGPVAIRCLANRTKTLMKEAGEVFAGNMAGVLVAAGLVRRLPWGSWYWIDHGKDRERDKRYEKVLCTSFEPATPGWAYDLARRLSRDKGLARALGFTQKRRLVKTYMPRTRSKGGVTIHDKVVIKKEWTAVDLDKVLPLHVRAQILRVAAANPVARELIADDPHAAGIIIRGYEP